MNFNLFYALAIEKTAHLAAGGMSGAEDGLWSFRCVSPGGFSTELRQVKGQQVPLRKP